MAQSTVFYAWQSDTPNQVNRSFIRRAAEDAVKRIAADAAVEEAPRLDQDTKDVPGTPPIAETIFEKIRNCSAFLADVTLVGSIATANGSASQKRTPNPNVMIELAYAASAVGWKRIVLVMNTAYGPPGKLPFDLRYRRRPIRFDASPGTSSSRERSDLAGQIERALRAILELGPGERSTALPEQVQAAMQEFHAAVNKGEFAKFDPGRGVLAVSIMPEGAPKNVSVFLDAVADETEKFQPFRCNDWGYRRRGRFFRTFAGKEESPKSLTEVDELGNIHAITNQIFTGEPSGNERVWRIHWSVISDMPVERLWRYLNVLRVAGLRGFSWLSVALLELPTSRIEERRGQGDPQICEGDVVPDPVRLEIRDAELSFDFVAQALRPALDYLWREFNQVNCPLFDASENWTG